MIRRRPSISIYFDQRRKKKSGKYPVKLRLTASWLSQKDKYIYLGIDLTLDEWSQVDGKGRAQDIAEIREELNRQIADAHRIVDDMEYYTHGAFMDKFIRGVVEEKYVYDFFNSKIESLKSKGRFSTADGYKSALASLRLYRHNRKIYFQDVTVLFLQGYISSLTDQGKSNATIKTYVRYFQAIYNIAIEEGIVSSENSPFNSSRIELPTASRAKKALPDKIISSLIKYSSTSENLQFARDMWVFSFCVGGANLTDIARMTKNNIHDDALFYHRGKTARAKNEDEAIIVYLNNEAKAIIEKYKGGPFLFPIQDPDFTDKGKYQRVKWYSKKINQSLKWIGREIGHNKITFGSARHSFATRMNKLGVDQSVIGLKMGHAKDSSITELYIKKEASQFKGLFDNLIDF